MACALRERKNLRLLLIAAGSVLLAWVPGTLMRPWPQELVVAIEAQLFVVAAVLAVRWHWKVALVALLLSPVHFRFWESAYRYTRGEAYYVTYATSRPLADLLEDQRIPLLAVGPAPSTLEWWLWVTPQNAAVDLCLAAFGEMPGAYDGPLPTSLDIRISVAESPFDAELAAVQQGSISVGDTLVQVRQDVGPRMIKVAMGRIPEERCLSTKKARVALWQSRVLVVAMPWETDCDPSNEETARFSFAAAIDAQSGRVLGYHDLDSGLGNEAYELAGIWLLNNYGSAH